MTFSSYESQIVRPMDADENWVPVCAHIAYPIKIFHISLQEPPPLKIQTCFSSVMIFLPSIVQDLLDLVPSGPLPPDLVTEFGLYLYTCLRKASVAEEFTTV
jgi:hypothetical protein